MSSMIAARYVVHMKINDSYEQSGRRRKTYHVIIIDLLIDDINQEKL